MVFCTINDEHTRTYNSFYNSYTTGVAISPPLGEFKPTCQKNSSLPEDKTSPSTKG